MKRFIRKIKYRKEEIANSLLKSTENKYIFVTRQLTHDIFSLLLNIRDELPKKRNSL